jgi:hypothetical protein
MFKSLLVTSISIIGIFCQVSNIILTPYLPTSTQEEQDEGGLCLDSADVALACTAGTPVGEKLLLAFAACAGGEEEMVAEGRRGKKGCRGRKCKGKGKGKGKRPKCPTVDGILEELQMEMEGKSLNHYYHIDILS